MANGKKSGRRKIANNVYYDKDRKTYYVRFYYGVIDGKPKSEWKTFKTKNEALRNLKIFETNKIQGTVVEPGKITLGIFLDYWVTECAPLTCEYTTLYHYENMINNHIAPAIGSIPLKDLKIEDVTKYFNSLSEKGLSNNTIKKHYGLLKTALKRAVRENKVFTNIMDRIDPPKETAKEPTFYTPQELATLLDVVKEKPALSIAVSIAAFMGLRREEIIGLTWDNIDFENSTLTVREVITKAGSTIVKKEPKNRTSRRVIKIPNELLRELIQVRQAQKRNAELFGLTLDSYKYVFCKPDGSRYGVNYLSAAFRNILKQYNLKPIRFHDLRHTFASIAHEQGIDIFDISRTLGHSTVSTTSKVYTHLFDPVHTSVINSVEDSILKAKNKSDTDDNTNP